MSKNIKEHEEGYWHIKKFGFRMPLLIIYVVSTAISIIWIVNSLDTSNVILAIPTITLFIGVAYGWIACVDKL